MSENPILRSIENQEWLQPIEHKGPELIRNAFAAAGSAGQAAKNVLHGVWLKHPLHAAITDVPVGSWTVATALDVLEMRGHPEYRSGADAAVMVGLIGAIPAALSGMTDWSEADGRAQRVGAVHGILNVGAAAMYAGSYAARKSNKRGLGRWLGFLGFGFVLASSYLGGELSYALKLGTNHAPDPEGELPHDYTAAIPEAELTEGKPAKATVNGTDLVIVKRGAQIYALAAKCAHLGGPLPEGELEGNSIICPWHGSKFCLEDGHVENGPATSHQPALDVKVENGQVLVRAQRG